MQRTCILLACSFFCLTALAQQYPFVLYTPDDGLVNNRARAIFQDNEGKLYISTYGGLSVYDGSRFINYTTDNGLVTNLVNDIVEMGEDSLWIIPNAANVQCLVRGELKDIITSDHFYPVINQLIKSSDGFYYAIAEQGLFRFEKNRFEKIPLYGLPDTTAERNLGMGLEMNGKLFILYDKTISNSSSGALLVYDLFAKKIVSYQDTAYCFDYLRTPWNDLWVSTNKGVRKLNMQKLEERKIIFSTPPEAYEIPNTFVPRRMYVDHQKNIWFGSTSGLLKLKPQGGITYYTRENGLPSNTITFIFQDRENNIWFTNEQDGLIKLPGTDIEFFKELIPGFSATDMYVVPGTDSIWFYDEFQKKCLLHIENKPIQEYSLRGEITGISKLIGNKKMYFLNNSDIYEWNPWRKSINHLDLIYHNHTGNTEYSSGVLDANGHLVAVSNNPSSSSSQLTVLFGRKVLEAPLDYYSDQVTIDKHNRIWVASRSNKLFCFQITTTGIDTSLQLVRLYFDELPRGISPRSITTDNDGNIWIGTRDHGLYCLFFDSLTLKSWKKITMQNGLSENFVNYLYGDIHNTIWACTPSGLDKIKLTGDQIAVGNVKWGNNMYPSVEKIMPASNGVLWALTKSGVIKINPSDTISSAWKPNLLFSEMFVGSEKIFSNPNHLSLSYRQNNISFHIAAPSFKDEIQTRYSFLLEGSNNSTWSEPSSLSEINLVNLKPGRYTLHAKAIFLNGTYPDTESAFSFTITPPWWQTWWFRGIAIMLIIGILILVLRFYYKRKLERQMVVFEKQQAIEKERTRIATDMHDDLGAALSRIKFLSESIKSKKGDHESFRKDIEKISTYSDEMAERMGEIVWALNEKNDTVADLIGFTRSYAYEYLSGQHILCKLDTPLNLPPTFIPGEMRQHIFLSVKECLHNIVKHAEATQVNFNVRLGNEIKITIHDNGKGIDWNAIRPFSNGLENIRRRMKEIHGEVRFENQKGTKVILSAPMHL